MTHEKEKNVGAVFPGQEPGKIKILLGNGTAIISLCTGLGFRLHGGDRTGREIDEDLDVGKNGAGPVSGKLEEFRRKSRESRTGK